MKKESIKTESDNLAVEEKKETSEVNKSVSSVQETTKTCDNSEDAIAQVNQKQKLTVDEVVKNLDESISEYSSDGSPSPAPIAQVAAPPKPVEKTPEIKTETPVSKQPEPATPVVAKPQTLQTFNIPVTLQQPLQQPQLIYQQPGVAQYPNGMFPHQQPHPPTIQHMYFNQAVINNGMPVQSCFNPALYPQQAQPIFYDQMQFQQQQFVNGQQMMYPGIAPPGSQPIMMQIHPPQGVMFNPGGMFQNQAPGMQPGFMPIAQNGTGNTQGGFNQQQTNLFQPHLGI